MIDDIEQWVNEARQGRISRFELAEKILQSDHPKTAEHHPDVDRVRRCGLPEVIFGSGKSPDAIADIANRLLDANEKEILVTRVEPSVVRQTSQRFVHMRYDSLGRTLRVSRSRISPVADRGWVRDSNCCRLARVTVVTAGSTDLPVAREALETLRWMGIDSKLVCDVGVAGPYRCLSRVSELRESVAIVVVAGMEGALASFVGGLVSCPVIAVPSSVGYGANLAGVTTLLSMISSCAASVTTVNIDAGFKGGYIAGLIARQVLSRLDAASLMERGACR